MAQFVILLVDSGSDQAERLRKELSEFDAELVHTQTGSEALQRAADVMPHLVIVDINLTDGSGFVFYSKLKRNSALSDSAFFITAERSDRAKIQEHAKRKFRAHAYLFKPYDLNALKEAYKRAFKKEMPLSSLDISIEDMAIDMDEDGIEVEDISEDMEEIAVEDIDEIEEVEVESEGVEDDDIEIEDIVQEPDVDSSPEKPETDESTSAQKPEPDEDTADARMQELQEELERLRSEAAEARKREQSLKAEKEKLESRIEKLSEQIEKLEQQQLKEEDQSEVFRDAVAKKDEEIKSLKL